MNTLVKTVFVVTVGILAMNIAGTLYDEVVGA
ncbi:hypothetical protein [Pseudomonas phage PA1C]|uniref:Uncharacterized protein n=1 Tax=Pseudomonas phage vB_PaeM_PS119XW TaxID=2601632 RepID=A0A5C1K921_9CAUD|nr:hypothetical protein PP933_gp115 [Pseudomonas phage vB_PaeM_PS119XW]QBX32270.1 hypothetical protein [Pseudomonas phage PA1C]QEM41844.1 hypothetical protein [Pseudomonas phage vB_PaeM_PS119XW]